MIISLVREINQGKREYIYRNKVLPMNQHIPENQQLCVNIEIIERRERIQGSMYRLIDMEEVTLQSKYISGNPFYPDRLSSVKINITYITWCSRILFLYLKISVNIVTCSVFYRFEKHFGQMADGAFCVTKAMQHELAQNWGIRQTDQT